MSTRFELIGGLNQQMWINVGEYNIYTYDKASSCGENHLGLTRDRIQNRFYLKLLTFNF